MLQDATQGTGWGKGGGFLREFQAAQGSRSGRGRACPSTCGKLSAGTDCPALTLRRGSSLVVMWRNTYEGQIVCRGAHVLMGQTAPPDAEWGGGGEPAHPATHNPRAERTPFPGHIRTAHRQEEGL